MLLSIILFHLKLSAYFVELSGNKVYYKHIIINNINIIVVYYYCVIIISD